MSAAPAIDHAVFTAPVTIFTGSQQLATVVVPDGARGILLVRGSSPSILIDRPGHFEMSVHQVGLDPSEFPCGLATVDLKHVRAWLALSDRQVGRLIDRLQRELDARAVSQGIDG